MTKTRLTLNCRPRRRVVWPPCRRLTLDLGLRTLDHRRLAAGKIFGNLSRAFVAVLIERHEKLALATGNLLVERADHAAPRSFGLAADADVIGSPRGRHAEHQP